MAAAKFSKEANLQPQQKCHFIEARKQIKEAILNGQIEGAITAINELDPEVCEFHYFLPTASDDSTLSFMHHSEAFGLWMRNTTFLYEDKTMHRSFLQPCLSRTRLTWSDSGQ